MFGIVSTREKFILDKSNLKRKARISTQNSTFQVTVMYVCVTFLLAEISPQLIRTLQELFCKITFPYWLKINQKVLSSGILVEILETDSLQTGVTSESTSQPGEWSPMLGFSVPQSHHPSFHPHPAMLSVQGSQWYVCEVTAICQKCFF